MRIRLSHKHTVQYKLIKNICTTNWPALQKGKGRNPQRTRCGKLEFNRNCTAIQKPFPLT